MGRWEPDAQGRLRRVAFELYATRGFDATTVADIAEGAGVTERTFFRHFADKREVLFAGSELLEAALVDGLARADRELPPLERIAIALEAAGDGFPGREDAAVRKALVDGHPHLQERELIKLAGLSTALAEGLREQGVPGPVAVLTADAGLAVFRSAFDRWVHPAETRDFPALVRESLAELKGITLGAAG